MALRKTITNKAGIDSSYWIIRKILGWDKFTGEVEVALYGYIDRNQRDSHPLFPVDTRVLKLELSFSIEDPAIQTIYDLISVSKKDDNGNETNEFAGAEIWQ